MSDERQKARRPPWAGTLLIWAALMALLAASLGVAYLPIGVAGTAVGIGIAFCKAALVAALYMELSRANALIRLAVVAGGLLLSVLFALTFADALTRGWVG